MPPPALRRGAACCNASCRHAHTCQATRGGAAELLAMRDVVERVGPFADGDRLVQPDAPHLAAYAVLSGLAMTVGGGRILAFHLPGELFALDVARQGQHMTSVVAVGKTWFCRFPRAATDALCEHDDAIASHLRGLRRQERRRATLGGDTPALARVAFFLDDLLARRRQVEPDTTFIPLPMSRDDIGSYLGMSAATVTRMLGRLRAEGILTVRNDGIDIADPAALAGHGLTV
ncbi:Crp/Fnr family transcriptional regulator [Luteibacter aegosomatissinici]|uniref:Crp/Fnr family transcriptional regulator n=1 Tax=Luteibacter aegosomatissinici TaxID=2911539 RepID=UPI001FF9F875|nr:Crp/Fnr family transcriptional regulator [Luteibacter aegosomatissinici]UPG96220.1 Crp/Fnr family transcriptional regulator [Luteibacter aegosomatissinici]